MIVVPVKEGENIEKALKKFKRKFEKTGVVKELRSRQQYDTVHSIEQYSRKTSIKNATQYGNFYCRDSRSLWL